MKGHKKHRHHDHNSQGTKDISPEFKKDDKKEHSPEKCKVEKKHLMTWSEQHPEICDKHDMNRGVLTETVHTSANSKTQAKAGKENNSLEIAAENETPEQRTTTLTDVIVTRCNVKLDKRTRMQVSKEPRLSSMRMLNELKTDAITC